MVTHLCLFKLKENTPERKKECTDALLSMIGKVPMLRSLEVGGNYFDGPFRYDVGLVARFESRADFEAYEKDPYHIGVVGKRLMAICSGVKVVDFES